jgi:hypothetical protein
VGIFTYQETEPLVDPEELLRLREAMRVRGPDGEGLWLAEDRRVGLAYLGGWRLGLPGVILGTITGDLLLPCWFVPYLLSRYQPRFSGWFFVKEIGPVILSLAVLISLPWSAPMVIAGLSRGWQRLRPGADGEQAKTMLE